VSRPFKPAAPSSAAGLEAEPHEATAPPQWVQIDWAGRQVGIEYKWLNAARSDQPLLVFLHEGLGSLSMWRHYPAQLCDVLGWRGLVYSRPGYGRSSPRPSGEPLQPDFMHRQARQVLPALLSALGVDAARQPPWLLGHSDGGSIALLYAAAWPQQIAGVVVLAPHILVEALSLQSILHARRAFLDTDLRQRLARHHADPDAAFWGWNDIWLHPSFSTWSIEDEIRSIRCPLLAVQGLDDEYGTLAQIRGIQQRAPQTRLLELPDCGHSPHRDQPQTLSAAIAHFLQTPTQQLLPPSRTAA